MPIKGYFGGHGAKVMRAMVEEYGAAKGKQVFYATARTQGKKSAKQRRGSLLHGEKRG